MANDGHQKVGVILQNGIKVGFLSSCDGWKRRNLVNTAARVIPDRGGAVTRSSVARRQRVLRPIRVPPLRIKCPAVVRRAHLPSLVACCLSSSSSAPAHSMTIITVNVSIVSLAAALDSEGAFVSSATLLAIISARKALSMVL